MSRPGCWGLVGGACFEPVAESLLLERGRKTGDGELTTLRY